MNEMKWKYPIEVYGVFGVKPHMHIWINFSIFLKEKEVYSWSAEEQGFILGAFFYGYVITQVPGGYLSEKYGGKWFFGLGTFSSAIFTLLTPMAAKGGLPSLIIIRFLIGLGNVSIFMQ